MKYTREETTFKVTHKGVDYYYIMEHKASNSIIFTSEILDAVYLRNVSSSIFNRIKNKNYILATKDGVVSDTSKAELDKTLSVVTLTKTIEIKG